MLHLCNITAGVWGRYAGEDTRPFDAYLQQRWSPMNGTRCCAFATVCAKKKRGHFCPRNSFLFSSFANDENLFCLYRKWFTLCDCIVGCPNDINACRDDVVILQRLQTLADCIVCTIVGCFTANQVSLYWWGIIGNAPLAHCFGIVNRAWHYWQRHCNRDCFKQNSCTFIGIELFYFYLCIALRLCNNFFLQCRYFFCIGFAFFLCHFFSFSVSAKRITWQHKVYTIQVTIQVCKKPCIYWFICMLW